MTAKASYYRFADSELGAYCGYISYVQNGCRTDSCAFEHSDRIRIELKVPRAIGVASVVLEYRMDGCEITNEIQAAWSRRELDYDAYSVALPSAPLVGLYFYTFRLFSAYGEIYACPKDGKVEFCTEQRTSFQFSVSDFLYDPPESIYGGVIYHIFVDRFARGGKVPVKEDARLIENWPSVMPEYPAYPGAHLKNNTFYGGTLWGIEKKLGYLSSLGVKAIYLSPIFDARSNHKYDTGNYMQTDVMFGADKALRSLIKSASKLGIGIILDGVFNHTGDDSLYFNRYGRYPGCGAYQSLESPYYSWYDFKNFPDDYTSWWGIEILPRINPDKPECAEYFVGNGGVIDLYASMGVLGFRLDVVDELSDKFVSAIKARLSLHSPNSVLYGEVWEDASSKISYGKRKRYYLGAELDGVMNYPLRSGIIAYLRNEGKSKLLYALTDIINNAPKRIRDAQMNLLGTHDTERIITALAGEPSDGRSMDYLARRRMTPEEYELGVRRLKMAYTVLATLPGIPTIFYGDEAGLEGYGDPFNRMPYPWGEENTELLKHYKRVGEIRSRASSVYAKGEFKLLVLEDDVLAFVRYSGREAMLSVVNNSNRVLRVRCQSSKLAPQIGASAQLSPHTSEIFKIKRNLNIYLDFIEKTRQ